MSFEFLNSGIVKEYDEHGRLVFSVLPSGRHYTFSYDGTDFDAMPTREYDSDGTVREYTIDPSFNGFTIDEYPIDSAFGKQFEPIHRIID